MGRFEAIPGREQSRAEETANATSHGIALAAMAAGSPFLALRAAHDGDAAFVVGTSIFSATAIVLYFASTIYHVLPIGKAKRVFRLIEHSAIYLLIAGTYTPFTLGMLRGVSYTVGVVFFALDSRLRYGHLIWHLFVIAGTTCHYFAVLWYAV